MLFSHPRNKETLLGGPELLPASRPILTRLQTRSIDQCFLCLTSSPVMLPLGTFPDYIRSSHFPAKHLKRPHSWDMQSEQPARPSSTRKAFLWAISSSQYFSLEGSDLCCFSVAFPVPNFIMSPSEAVKCPFLAMFSVEDGTPDDKGIHFSACFFHLPSRGWEARAQLIAKGPNIEELGPCPFLSSDYFPTSGIYFPCVIRLFYTLGSTLVFSNQSWKGEVCTVNQRPVSVGVRELRGTLPHPCLIPGGCGFDHCRAPGLLLLHVIMSHCLWSMGNAPEWWSGPKNVHRKVERRRNKGHRQRCNQDIIPMTEVPLKGTTALGTGDSTWSKHFISWEKWVT